MTIRGERVKRLVLAGGLACFALPAAALDPEVNLSGTFGLGLSYFQDESAFGEVTDADVENNASSFRITAAAQEVGLRAFIAYERGASNDQVGIEDVREFFGGVSGWLGKLLYGRKATDYRLAGERLDPFYNTSVAFSPALAAGGGFATEGAGYGLSALTSGFTSNTIAYRTPVLAGFSANVAGYVSDNNSQQGNGDETDFGLGVGYTNTGWLNLDVGVQALDLNGAVVAGSPGAGSTAYRVHGSIGANLWAAGASYERIDVPAEADPRHYVFVAGSYQLFEPLRLAASYGQVSNTPFTTGFDGSGVTLGAFYDLMRHLTVYAAARRTALDNAAGNTATVLATGVKFVFDVDL
jgi:hypothetical protein